MKSGISKIVLLLLLCPILFGGRAVAQQREGEYQRSSIYSLLVAHPEFRYGEEITEVFATIPIPEKFNDHNLNRRIINSLYHKKKREAKDEPLELTEFLQKNAIARRLVAKWYNRQKGSGAFDMTLIQERGFYDASFQDIELAKADIRGLAQLADAGEELINNTFVLINDIYYVDKELQAQKWALALDIIGAVAGGLSGADTSGFSDAANLIREIEGFRVMVISHLYKLNFSEEVMWEFYNDYFFSQNNIDAKKKLAFDQCTDLFKLDYVGSQVVASGKTSLKGVNTDTPEQMIKKVCTRAIDKSIVELQRANEVFRVKTPLHSTGPTITAKIGMKEGVSESSRYEVLMRKEKDGRTTYERQGVLRPAKGLIWDNRYMSVEELAENATLDVTTFEVVSGCKDITPGMLIREIKM